MSEAKLISPMLDNFAMGDPISDRNGVRCCPAMRKDTDDKYIVKIISIPSSPNQLEALLLSGAYNDKAEALSYFNVLSNGVVEEAQTLQKLSQLEGFVPYENWQIVPMDDEAGYDVYLLSSYKNSLDQYFRHNPMTHLGALNLGLDLCSALAVCRHSGYLYVDLKPDNVYITGENTYRIGDIGFLKLDSLKYASLSDRYRSQYTAPEIQDAYSALNTTVDIYALGLILYQAFNAGILPTREEANPEAAFPPPAYADYEMAEIILKACSFDPAQRWQDPVEMGQALVSYMQRNGAHDTPIIPTPTPDDDIDIDAVSGELVDTVAEIDSEDTEEPEQNNDGRTEVPQEDAESGIYEEDAEGNLTFLSTDGFDEAELDAEAELIDYEEVTDEVSEILVQADELIAHPAPDPVIPPEPIEVPIPEPLPVEEDEATETDADQQDEAEAEESSGENQNEESEQEEVAEEDTEEATTEDVITEEEDVSDEEQPAKRSHWLRNTILSIMAVAVLALGFLYYKYFYLQPIDSIMLDNTVSGELTVYISSPIDEKKLTVVCSDTYGNQLTAPVENGKATFKNLAPNSAFNIEVIMNGFHKLIGDTSAAFTTPVQTNIVQFNAVTGSEDGSVILGFTIDGPDSDQWIIRYAAADEEEQEVTFAGHMTTLTGLTVGKTYTFTLQPAGDLLYTGVNEIQHTASQIVKAENLMITGCVGGIMTVSWSAPKDASVDSWTVRCYSENGHDETTVCADTNAVFEGVDLSTGYTVEVTAAGMSVNQRAFAEANAITVGLSINDTDPNKIVLSWEPAEGEPESGWLLQYSIDGAAAQELTCSPDNTATVPTKIPGANYTFTLQVADGTPLLGGVLYYETPAAEAFAGYGVTADSMEFKMCKTPKTKNWDRYDLKKSDYTTTFETGKKASFLVRMKQAYSTSRDDITTLFVIRDASGAVVSSESVTKTWTSMWHRNYCELNIPAMPKAAGNYTISVYFNGSFACEQAFTITK